MSVVSDFQKSKELNKRFLELLESRNRSVLQTCHELLSSFEYKINATIQKNRNVDNTEIKLLFLAKKNKKIYVELHEKITVKSRLKKSNGDYYMNLQYTWGCQFNILIKYAKSSKSLKTLQNSLAKMQNLMVANILIHNVKYFLYGAENFAKGFKLLKLNKVLTNFASQIDVINATKKL